MSKEDVLKCFVESSTGILTFGEVQSWCRESQLDDTNLHDQLQCLVESGEIGCRTVGSSNGKEHTIWFNTPKASQETSVKTPLALASTTKPKGSLGTPQTHSSKLRERLKRNRQGFVSPLLSNQKKKPKLVEEEHSTSDQTVRGKLEFNSQSLTPLKPTSLSGTQDASTSHQNTEDEVERPQTDTCDGLELLQAEKRTLETKLAEKRETLRKLKMVKLYRSKNDLQSLESLTRQWRDVSQEAAEVLLGYSTREPRPSMAQLLDHFHIDVDLIHYSVKEEAFY